MNEKEKPNEKVCRNSDVYIDATSGIVFASGLREKRTVTAPTEKEIRAAKRSPMEKFLLKSSIFLATTAVIATIAYCCYMSGVGSGTADKLNKADQVQDQYIKDTYPREPYRDDVRGE